MGLVAAVGVAATAIASSVGIAVTATALTVGFEVISAVGIGLSVIGAVTKDKVLSDVGMGLGLVGGIGSLAAGAGVIGGDAASGGDLFGPSAAASTADTGAAATSSDVVDSFSSAGADAGTGAMYEGAGFDTADTGTAAAGGTAAANAAPPMFAGAPDQPFEGAATDTAGSATAAGPTTAGPPTTTGTPTPTPDPAALEESMQPNPAMTAGADSTMPVPPVPPTEGGILNAATGQFEAPSSSGLLGSIGDSINKVLDYAGAHPLIAYGALQAGGSLLQSAFSTLTPAQVSALNAQAANNQAAANLTTLQTQNIGQPKTVATLAPVTGTPNNIITPPTAGIINSAPKVNVTGAAA